MQARSILASIGLRSGWSLAHTQLRLSSCDSHLLYFACTHGHVRRIAHTPHQATTSAMTRVVVTGLGAVTPLGNDVRTSWQALLAGTSGIGPIRLFDASQFEEAIAGEVKDFRPESFLPAKEARHIDRSVQFAMSSAIEALADARI